VLIAVLQAAIKQQPAELIISDGDEKTRIIASPLKVIYSGGHWLLVSQPDGAGNGEAPTQDPNDDDDPHWELLADGQIATPLCMVTDVEIASED
jgi:hypothetical protein